jgi:hypothetical protein
MLHKTGNDESERIAVLETRVAELEREKACVRIYMERATTLYGRALRQVEEIMDILKRIAKKRRA